MQLDVRELAAINISESSSFLATSDGSGAYFFVQEQQSFIFLNFETAETINLTLEKFKTINDSFNVISIVLFDGYVSNSPETTIFVALVDEKRSETVFCVLFSANISLKTVSIFDEVCTNWTNSNFPSPYIYKESSGNIFALNYGLSSKSVSVSRIRLTGSRKMIIEPTAKQTMNDSDWPFPFIEDNALCRISADEYGDLIIKKDSLDKNISSCGPLLINKQLPPSLSYCVPIQDCGRIFFCSNGMFDESTTIWSLNMKERSWSRHATVYHHRDKAMDPKYLQILKSESAFLLISCGECKSTSHVYQFDTTIGIELQISQNLLGKGSFGTVMEGTLGSQQRVAIKIARVSSDLPFDKQRQFLRSAISEARKLKTLAHKNIVKCYGFKVEKDRFLFCMELMAGSVRQKILRTAQLRLSVNEALQILQQALEGLMYLHTFQPEPIVHRDIKCDNILLDQMGTAKLGDFGFAKHISLNTAGSSDRAVAPNERVGTNFWKAPEVMDINTVYGRKADVWSIGCSLVEMLTGYPPYYYLPPMQWAYNLNSEKLAYSPEHLISNVTMDVARILEKCFRRQTKLPVGIAASNQQIRPHSWEILDDVMKINRSKPS